MERKSMDELIQMVIEAIPSQDDHTIVDIARRIFDVPIVYHPSEGKDCILIYKK